MLQPVAQRQPVGELGQRVMEGEMVNFFGRFMALGHIMGDNHHIFHPPFAIADRPTMRLHEPDITFGRDEAVFEMLPQPACHRLAEGLLNALPVSRMDFRKGNAAAQVTIAHQFCVGRAVINPPSVMIENRDVALNILGNQTKELLLVAQGIFDAFAGANVGNRQITDSPLAVGYGLNQDGDWRFCPLEKQIYFAGFMAAIGEDAVNEMTESRN